MKWFQRATIPFGDDMLKPTRHAPVTRFITNTFTSHCLANQTDRLFCCDLIRIVRNNGT